MVYNRLILFTSYYFASKMENLAKEARLSVQLIPTPASLSHACGMCIICQEEELSQLVSVMKQNGISHSGIYQFNGPHQKVYKLPLKGIIDEL